MEKLPAFLYGSFPQVKQATSKLITQIKKGASIHELVATQEWINPASVPAIIFLDGPNPLAGSAKHFHLYVLPRLLLVNKVIYDAKQQENMQRLFTEMMEDFWSHMVLSCGQNVYSFYSWEENRKIYLAKLKLYKSRYESLNSRFHGLPLVSWNLQGEQISSVTSVFDHPYFIGKYVVGNLDQVKLSFKPEELNEELRTNDLFSLIERLSFR